jgi:hydroxyacylglutathione hydrolase
MSFSRHVTRALGHATTIVICDKTQQAFVVDPGRDIDPYVAAAAEHGFEIAYVADTHGHNDYLSGAAALVARTGATGIAHTSSDDRWAEQRCEHGARIQVGDVEIEVLHTPGHTPEHIAFLVHEPGASAPVLISGGSLLVGDVGRPDLLGGAAGSSDAARTLTSTILDVLLELDDDVRVLPTHVAGSLCAGAIGGDDETTIGAERRSNPTVLAMQAERDGGAPWYDAHALPPVPAYWRRMRSANQAGVPEEQVPDLPARLGVDDAVRIAGGAAVLVIDTRDREAYAAAHPAGAQFLPAGDSFLTWAGAVVAADTDLLLIANSERSALASTRDAWRIGLGPVVGFLSAAAIDDWNAAGGTIAHLEQLDMADALRDEVATMIDVRAPNEHRATPIPGAVEVPGTLLAREIERVPAGPVDIVCGSGMRSMVIASLLQRAGRVDVRNVRGGITGSVAVG